jgi:hypothetical protein
VAARIDDRKFDRAVFEEFAPREAVLDEHSALGFTHRGDYLPKNAARTKSASSNVTHHQKRASWPGEDQRLPGTAQTSFSRTSKSASRSRSSRGTS